MTKRPIIILDLDETLINSEERKKFNHEKYGNKMEKFKYHKMERDFYVFERPHLQEFLDFLFENFDVSIWTAASRGYALWILKNVLNVGTKNRPIKHVFFDYHCKASEKLGSGKKDLSLLSSVFGLKEYDMGRVFIIDDNKEICESQPDNCIPIKEFEFKNDDSENDDYLLNVKTTLKRILDVLEE